MEKKHINRKKTYVPDDITNFSFNAKPDDDTWSRFQPILGEKIISEEIIPIPDRSITFNRNKVEKLEDNYNNETKEFKDKFSNTAQYLKFLNAHLAEKKNHLDKIVSDQDRFDDDIASLNPERISKEQLDRMNYNKLKVTDVQKVLEKLQNERELIKEKIEHFSNQMNQAKAELTNKDKQIGGIKSEISLAETIENPSQSEIEKGKDVAEVIQQELESLAPKNESEKIFGAINSLVVLLNSKNQTTLNELNAVKNEFKKMKQEYDKVMNNLEQKK
ncbi:MAG: coiled-coil domain-containing protein [Nitrosopumilaceae archaeon]